MKRDRNSERDIPTRIRSDVAGTAGERFKELSDLADEKFIEYWFCEDRKESKRLHSEYIALIKEANEIASSRAPRNDIKD